MPVVMILVAVAILAGVFFAATGRGGELAYEQADHAPLDLGPVSAADVARLRPPTAMWGYNMQVTDEALERIAQAVRDRDVTIAYLQQRLAGLNPDPAAPHAPADQPAPAVRDEPGPPAPGLQQHSPEQHGPDQPSPEQHGPEQPSPEQPSPREHSPEQPSPRPWGP